LRVVGPHGWVISEVLFQEPGRQFPCERAGAIFPLRERDRRWLLVAVEIEIESGCCLLQPLLPELFAGRLLCLWMFIHGCLPVIR